MNWLSVAIGGAIGALTRWGLFRSWVRTFPEFSTFWATLIVNMIGCFLIGFIFAYATAKSSTDNFKLFWIVGFLGGLTTFSAFGLDIFQMMQTKPLYFTAGYFLFHGLICVVMVYFGNFIFQLQ